MIVTDSPTQAKLTRTDRAALTRCIAAVSSDAYADVQAALRSYGTVSTNTVLSECDALELALEHGVKRLADLSPEEAARWSR
jgi:hypothetical protein